MQAGVCGGVGAVWVVECPGKGVLQQVVVRKSAGGRFSVWKDRHNVEPVAE